MLEVLHMLRTSVDLGALINPGFYNDLCVCFIVCVRMCACVCVLKPPDDLRDFFLFLFFQGRFIVFLPLSPDNTSYLTAPEVS